MEMGLWCHTASGTHPRVPSAAVAGREVMLQGHGSLPGPAQPSGCVSSWQWLSSQRSAALSPAESSPTALEGRAGPMLSTPDQRPAPGTGAGPGLGGECGMEGAHWVESWGARRGEQYIFVLDGSQHPHGSQGCPWLLASSQHPKENERWFILGPQGPSSPNPLPFRQWAPAEARVAAVPQMGPLHPGMGCCSCHGSGVGGGGGSCGCHGNGMG